MTYTATINGVASPTGFTLLRVRRTGMGEIRTVWELIPGQEGSTRWQEELGDALLVWLCMIEVNDVTLRRDKIREVMKWLQRSDEIEIIISDQPTRLYRGRLYATPNPDEMRYLSQFELQFRVDPYQYETSISNTTTTINASPDPYSGTIAVDTGDVETKPIIEVQALDPLTNGFALTLNGLTITYPVAMILDEIVTINCISSIVSTGVNGDLELTGFFDPNDLIMHDVAGLFPELFDGSNSLGLSRLGASGDTKLTFYWRKRWMP